MVYNIVGKDNKTLKHIKALKKKSVRFETGHYVAEGKRIVEEAFMCASELIYCIVMSKSFMDSNESIADRADELCERVYSVSDSVFESIANTQTPQGILAVMKIKESAFDLNEATAEFIVLDSVSEPGNLGTVIRTAEAFGYDGVFLMKGCADIYSQKTVRSTMGSLFRMKFKTDCSIDDIKDLKNNGFCIISTSPSAKLAIEGFAPQKKQAIVIGNEAHGVSQCVLENSDYILKITMNGKAESLNAAVAAGIAMHQLKYIQKI